ncbi:MAG: polysaccharide deacetylase family protein [bacterium]|nr:polysaccharide deacetylase family protein [bacterium]
MKKIYTLLLPIRKFVYKSLFELDKLFETDGKKIVIYCYHSIANDNWKYSVDLSMFKLQINHLLKKYRPMSVRDMEMVLLGIKTLNDSSFVLTFDDGHRSILAVKDFLKQKGIVPALFICAKPEEISEEEFPLLSHLLGINEIIGLAESYGWEIGCHGATHTDLSKLSVQGLYNEINLAKKRLEQVLGLKINYFAYPRGKYNQKAIRAVEKAGFKLAFTVDDGLVNSQTEFLKIPRQTIERSYLFEEFQTISSPSTLRLKSFLIKTPMKSLMQK